MKPELTNLPNLTNLSANSVSEDEAQQIARIMQNLKVPNKDTVPVPPPGAATVANDSPAAVTTRRLTKEEYAQIKNQAPIPIPPETMAKLQATVVENIANERANSEPFPDSTAIAFDPVDPAVTVFNLDTQKEETLHIRGLVPADIRIFKMIQSPLYSLIMGDLKTEPDALNKFSVDEDALYDLVWQFTHSSREAATLAKKGIETYREVSFDLAHKYSAPDLLKLTEVVISFIGQVNGSKAQFSTTQSVEELEAEAAKKKAT